MLGYMKGILILFLLILCRPAFSDNTDNDGLHGKTESNASIQFIKKIPSTPVRDQNKTSTCWSFSGISLIETELIRMKKGEYDLSEMYIVRYNYERKADRYIRMHGKTNFAPGGETNDVTDVYDTYGIVPESVYSGLKPNEKNHKHNEMDRILEKYVETLVSDTDQELNPVWMDGFEGVLDSYLGEIPDSFEYNGQHFTPMKFAEYLGIDPSDYVMITSFMHKPYYEPVILEIPDNWSWAKSYNVPLDVLEEIVDTAIIKGYSVAWACDISEEGFDFSKGFAMAPKICYSAESDHETAKWKKKSKEQKEEIIFSINNPVEELSITPENRQMAFDNFSTTDDHGMHILGLAYDRNGRTFYYVKNSWGADNPHGGYIFVSKPYFKFKTISIMLHKEALSEQVVKDLSL